MRSVLAVRAVTTPQFGFAYVAEAVRAWAWNFVVGPVDLSLSLGFFLILLLLHYCRNIYCSLILIPRKMEMSSESDAKSLLACSEYMGMNCIGEKRFSSHMGRETYSQRDRS